MTLSKLMRHFAPKIIGVIVLAEIYTSISLRVIKRYEDKRDDDDKDEMFFVGHEIDPNSTIAKTIRFKLDPLHRYVEIIENFILSASKSVHVTMYIFTLDIFAEALKKVHNRGVHVLVMIDKSMENSSGSRIHKLKEAGIRVKVVENKTLHLKMCLIDVDYDDKSFIPIKEVSITSKPPVYIPEHGCVINGSMNWTREGLLNNHENFTVHRNPNIVKTSANAFYKIWNSS